MKSKKETVESIEVNGVKYVRADAVSKQRQSVKLGTFTMVRTSSAGVFAGHLKSRTGQEVVLNDAVRIHYWNGAASLSELAMRGSSKPSDCQFPVAVDEVLLTQAVELIPISTLAEKQIKELAGKWTK